MSRSAPHSDDNPNERVLRLERRNGAVEKALLLELAVERGGLRVVTPGVVAGAVADAAEQLLLHLGEARPLRGVRQVGDLVATGHPAVGVAEEGADAGDLRV